MIRELIETLRDYPSARELKALGYERFAQQWRGLNRTEIWVMPGKESKTKDIREIKDIRVLDYALGGIARISSYRNSFLYLDDAVNFFTRNGVPEDVFTKELKPFIKIEYSGEIPPLEASYRLKGGNF